MNDLFNVTSENSEQILINALKNPNKINIVLAFNAGYVDEFDNCVQVYGNYFEYLNLDNEEWLKTLEIYRHDDSKFISEMKLSHCLEKECSSFLVFYAYNLGIRYAQLTK